MTAYELPGSDEDQYLRASGADHLLYKPLPAMDELLKKINEVVAKRKQEGKPEQESEEKPGQEAKPKQEARLGQEEKEKSKNPHSEKASSGR